MLSENEKSIIDKIVQDYVEGEVTFNEFVNRIRETIKKMYRKDVSFLELWEKLSGCGVEFLNVKRSVKKVFIEYRPKFAT